MTAALLALSFAAVGCSKDNSVLNDFQRNREAVRSEVVAPTVTVTSLAGTPIANARVMIGMRENVPFPGNVMKTNSQGQITAPSEKWNDMQPVTIDAPGYVRATFFNVGPGMMTFQLRQMPATENLELNGQTIGFGELKKDGFADVGLVFRALPRSGVATFDVSALMSPEMDSMTVMGQNLSLPSNLTVPKQTENYVLPITLNKPAYRTFFPMKGAYQVVSTHAKFPFKKTVDALRGGKSMFDVINDFEFVESTVKQYQITAPKQTMELPVNTVRYAKSIPFTAPSFEAGHKLLAIAGAEAAGLYYPTDVKTAAPGQSLMLTSPSTGAGQTMIVAALRKDGAPTMGAAAEEVTSVILAANASMDFSFMPIPAPPVLQAETLSLSAPRLPAGLDAALTYGLLSKVVLVGSTTAQFESKIPQWEIYAPAFAAQLTLPQMPGSSTADKMRWEVIFGAVPQNSQLPAPGPGALEKVSHVSRSALDL